VIDQLSKVHQQGSQLKEHAGEYFNLGDSQGSANTKLLAA